MFTGIDLSDITIGNRLSITTGAGDDSVGLNGVDVHGLVTINTWGGDDDLRIEEGSGLPSYFRGGIVVNTGYGNDAVILDSTTFSNGVWFEGSLGTNTLKSNYWPANIGWHDSYAHHFVISTII